jgi:hypothetical protein
LSLDKYIGISLIVLIALSCILIVFLLLSFLVKKNEEKKISKNTKFQELVKGIDLHFDESSATAEASIENKESDINALKELYDNGFIDNHTYVTYLEKFNKDSN